MLTIGFLQYHLKSESNIVFMLVSKKCRNNNQQSELLI